ncbi:membrane-associating domain-containing protein [Calycina marina]|uniref:Membrane-associating domain-containing protein n=1 Tax=Calycina marina TaxID=1763456 RepID=A0A9P7YVW1_9HELO|nr:membrane-associating domain-containing protein [Calycina marina]
MLPIRAVQAIFAIIVLGLLAYASDEWFWYWTSPSQINFLIFTSVWTLLAVAYLVITPGRFPTIAHKFGILAAEVLTMLFWFAGFIALAVLLTDVGCNSRWGVCSASVAGVVFAAFEWLLFSATTIMAALHVWRTRGSHSSSHDPNMEVRTPYEGA